MIPKLIVIEAPSILGLRPTVERLPAALKRANLLAELGAEYDGIIEPPSYDPKRDKTTLLLNPGAIRNYSVRLAEAVASALEKDRFPTLTRSISYCERTTALNYTCLRK
jgi:arginase